MQKTRQVRTATALALAAGLALLKTGLAEAQAAKEGLGTPTSSPVRKTPLDIHAKPVDHVSAYLEDPFVTKYRRKFFAVFRGDFSQFEQGMKEIEAMLAKNPRDARARVWHGNGLMVRAGVKRFTGQVEAGKKLLLQSKAECDRAVALAPQDVNILAMRAVTLHIAGEYWKPEELPKRTWETIIQDLEKSRAIIRPDRMPQLSVHARGEILSELANAYQKTGQAAKARELWQEIQKSVPDSQYAQQAEKALKILNDSSAPKGADQVRSR